MAMSLAEFLDTPMDDGIGIVRHGVNQYKALSKFRNVLTYSQLEVLHACPRKYMLRKLAAAHSEDEPNTNITFAFGHAVGAGVAEFDRTQSINDAIFAAFREWDVSLWAEEMKGTKPTGRSFTAVVEALHLYKEFYYSIGMDEWETVKVEAGVGVDLQNGYFYLGHIDELMRHKETGAYRIEENKHRGSAYVSGAEYENSDQALGYSVVIDSLGAQSYEVHYKVYCLASQEWKEFSFYKDVIKRLGWLQSLELTAHMLDKYQEVNFFPTRGSACNSYMRPCSELGLCDLSLKRRFPSGYNNLPVCKSLEHLAEIDKLDYAFTFAEILQDQQHKHNLG